MGFGVWVRFRVCKGVVCGRVGVFGFRAELAS